MSETKSSLFRHKKTCQFCMDETSVIDYKDVKLLSRYLSERGNMVPARVSATCAKHQRGLSKAVKRARFLALLPFVAD